MIMKKEDKSDKINHFKTKNLNTYYYITLKLNLLFK